jgi:ribosomal protein L9
MGTQATFAITARFLEADFWKVRGIPLDVRLKLHREVTATVKLAVQKQE